MVEHHIYQVEVGDGINTVCYLVRQENLNISLFFVEMLCYNLCPPVVFVVDTRNRYMPFSLI